MIARAQQSRQDPSTRVRTRLGRQNRVWKLHVTRWVPIFKRAHLVVRIFHGLGQPTFAWIKHKNLIAADYRDCTQGKNKGLGARYSFEYFGNIKSFAMSKLPHLPARRLEGVREVRFLALLSPCAPQHTWKSPRVTKGGQNLSLTINSQSFCYSPSASRSSIPLRWFHYIHWFYTYTPHLELSICTYYGQVTLHCHKLPASRKISPPQFRCWKGCSV